MRAIGTYVAIATLLGACSVESSGLPEGPLSDGGMCEPRVEVCNGRDDDCNGMVDEGFDTDTDPNNCGSCGTACPTDPDNAAAACVAGGCSLLCDAGFADCDGSAANGCEANLNDPEHCGDCATSCAPPAPFCQNDGGSSGCVSTCAAGRAECGTSCVDILNDVTHCGGCDRPCAAGVFAAPVCTGGSCGYACDAGYADCDGDTTAGCEQSLDSVEHCGACDMLCAPSQATGACPAMMCGIGVCNDGFGDCNTNATDGCELALTTSTDCGGCGVPCSRANAEADCPSGTCELKACDPGFGNCNADDTDGCEVDLRADPMNCMMCGVICDGACTPAGCIRETVCDGLDDNGNGLIDEGSICPCAVEQYMGHAYMFCTNRITWPNAESACRANGYELVTVDDAPENTWIASTAVGYSTADRWWIGYNDRGTEGSFVWSDPGATSTYDNWVGDEPNNAGCCGGEDCTEITQSGGWVDTECRFGGDTNHYICEAP